jgi:CDP-2,3-bis-(O-geranylgeranyl)-sn-glycerol synthase
MILILLGQSIWFIASAYVTNAFPTVVKGQIPVDGGRTWSGRRILGDSKTVEGTFAGLVFGIFIGFLQVGLQPKMPAELNLPVLTMPVVILLCTGTMFGDIVGSFIKRRLGINPGDPALLLDQLGFLIFAFIFASAATAIDINIVILLIILTPILHVLTNIFVYLLRLKEHPW